MNTNPKYLEYLTRVSSIHKMLDVYAAVCKACDIFPNQKFYIYDLVQKLYIGDITKDANNNIYLTPIEFKFAEKLVFPVDKDNIRLYFDDDFQVNKVDLIFNLLYQELVVERKGRSIYNLIASERLSKREIQSHTLQTSTKAQLQQILNPKK